MEPKAHERKQAAEKASVLYRKAFDQHLKTYGLPMTLIESAEAAMEAMQKVEEEFETLITATIDLQKMWWFQ